MHETTQMKYFIIKTEVVIGDIKNTITHLGKSKMRPKACQAEVAQSINHGRFDDDCYGQPCFDRDGFIAYPLSVTEISCIEFNQLIVHFEEYSLEQSETQLNETILEFLAA